MIAPLTSVGGSGHCATLLGALATRLDTQATMIVVVLGAFRGAFVADLCAQAADVARKIRLAAHECRRHRTDLRTVATQTDTLGHRLDMWFAEAGIGTMLARPGAIETGRNT